MEEEVACTFLTNMCEAKGISVPSSLLKSLTEESEELIIKQEDVETLGEEDRYKLLFCIAVFIQSGPEHIKLIKLREVRIPQALINTFSVALQKNTKIKEVELSGIGLNDEGLMALCIGLQSNPTITCIDLSGNEITAVGLEYLMDCFEADLPLSKLILSRNAIEEFSVGSVLRDNKTLQILNLSENNLDEAGIGQVLESLKFNQSILEVDLRQNISVKSTKIMYQLCELFLNNRSLKKFWLNAEIPTTILEKLATALMGNTQLVLWEGVNNEKLKKYVEANKVIHESLERRSEIVLDKYQTDLKEILGKKLSALGVKEKNIIEPIQEVSIEDHTESEDDRHGGQESKVEEIIDMASPSIAQEIPESFLTILQSIQDSMDSKIEKLEEKFSFSTKETKQIISNQKSEIDKLNTLLSQLAGENSELRSKITLSEDKLKDLHNTINSPRTTAEQQARNKEIYLMNKQLSEIEELKTSLENKYNKQKLLEEEGEKTKSELLSKVQNVEQLKAKILSCEQVGLTLTSQALAHQRESGDRLCYLEKTVKDLQVQISQIKSQEATRFNNINKKIAEVETGYKEDFQECIKKDSCGCHSLLKNHYFIKISKLFIFLLTQSTFMYLILYINVDIIRQICYIGHLQICLYKYIL